MSSRYKDSHSSYLKRNPDWHVTDSPWKAKQIVKMIKKNHLDAKRIAEVGCGAGEILNQLHHTLEGNINFFGYEIALDAFKLCESRKKDRLSFFNEDPSMGVIILIS